MSILRDLNTKNFLKTVNSSIGKFGRSTGALSHVWSELMMAAIPINKRDEFITNSYHKESWYFATPEGSRLFDWEKKAIDEFFPDPPAKILIGGCGGGREANVLIHMGYRVAAFDPCASLMEHFKNSQKDSKLIALEMGRYGDLVNGMQAIEKEAPFDAIILGWLSISHIMKSNTREQLFEKTKSLCPNGPVLVSWVAKESMKISSRRKGLRIAFKRAGLPNYQEDDFYCEKKGFTHLYSTKELYHMADNSGYIMQVLKGSTDHAILWPKK